jgi:hypothetical protein
MKLLLSPYRPIEPKARVSILYRNFETGKWEFSTHYELFTQIAISQSTQGSGSTAQITYPNPQGRYIIGKRKYNAFSKDPGKQASLRVDKELDWLEKVVKLGLVNYASDEALVRASTGREKKWMLHEHYLRPFPFEDFNGLVWIDFKGPDFVDTNNTDGVWYGVFTGVIIRVVDAVTKAGQSVISVHCQDLRRFLALTPVATSYNILPTRNCPTEYQTLIENAGFGTGLEHQWADLKGTEIWGRVFEEFVDKITRLGGKSPDSAPVKYRLWAPVDPYEGFSHLRGSDPKKDDIGISDLVIGASGEQSPYGTGKENDKRVLEANDSNLALAIRSMDTLFFDESFKDLQAFHAMVRSAFNIASPKIEMAVAILDRLAKVTMSDFYVDGMGNAIIAYPRYDAVPFIPNSGFDEKFYKDNLSSKDITVHGPNYIIGDQGLVSWNIVEDESQVITYAQTRFGLDQTNLGGVLDYYSNIGFSWAPFEDLLKYGYRQFSSEQVFFDALKEEGVRDAFADAVRRRLSARKTSASMVLKNRPDIQVGRTVFLVERELFFYVSALTHSYTAGGDCYTSYTLEYGRRPSERIGNPWEVLSKLTSDLIVRQPGTGEQKLPFIGPLEERYEASYADGSPEFSKNEFLDIRELRSPLYPFLKNAVPGSTSFPQLFLKGLEKSDPTDMELKKYPKNFPKLRAFQIHAKLAHALAKTISDVYQENPDFLSLYVTCIGNNDPISRHFVGRAIDIARPNNKPLNTKDKKVSEIKDLLLSKLKINLWAEFRTTQEIRNISEKKNRKLPSILYKTAFPSEKNPGTDKSDPSHEIHIHTSAPREE